MSIPYLPGWWDMLNQNGAVTNVVKGIDKRLRPDAYANQNLQQAIQQNPMLLDQISNMDPTQRQMLASGFGFKNENPFGGIAEGEQLTERKMKQDAIKSLTPEQMTQKKAKLAGVDTQESIDRTKVLQGREDTVFGQEQQKFQWEKELKDIQLPKAKSDAQLGLILNQEKERAIKQVQDLRKKYPQIDIDGIMKGMMSGQMTPQLMEQFQVLTSGDDNALSAFNTIMDFQKIRVQQRNSMLLRGAQNNDDLMRAATGMVAQAEKEANDAMRSYTAITGASPLTKMDMSNLDPERRIRAEGLLKTYQEAQGRASQYRDILIQATQKAGFKVNPLAPPPSGTVDPDQERINRINAALGRK